MVVEVPANDIIEEVREPAGYLKDDAGTATPPGDSAMNTVTTTVNLTSRHVIS
jgi:hypothetical protein